MWTAGGIGVEEAEINLMNAMELSAMRYHVLHGASKVVIHIDNYPEVFPTRFFRDAIRFIPS